MNREQMNELIVNHPDTELQSEIEHHLSIEDREYPYDPLCALLDIEDRAESDREFPENRRLLRACHDVLIELGFYRVMPQDEIASVTVTRGTKWCFKKAGVAYTTDHLVCDWFDGVVEAIHMTVVTP